MEKEFDFDDEAVVEMIKHNHVPRETWRPYAAHLILNDVRCDMCEHTWPCPTIQEVRMREKAYLYPEPVQSVETEGGTTFQNYVRKNRDV